MARSRGEADRLSAGQHGELSLVAAVARMSPAFQQAAAAQAVYDRDCALATVTAETGWQAWTGVGGILYVRLPKSSPSQVVRAPSTRALRAAIEARQSN